MPRLDRRLLGALLEGWRRVPPPGSQRMRRPDGRRYYAALAVVDVDLDSGTVTRVPPLTTDGPPPEGLFALVWHHGEPVGEFTVANPSLDDVPGLVRLAGRTVELALTQHRLRDAMAYGSDSAPAAPHSALTAAEPLLAPGPADVTIAICTRDRPDDLRLCLDAIAALDTPAAEVLVVDNASAGPGTREVAARYPFVRYVREPRRGLDWARNRALLEARTEIVVYADDDVLVHRRWVDAVVRAFTEEADAVVVTGLVTPAELATPAQILFEAHRGFGRGYTRRWFAADIRGGEVAARVHARIGGAGTGANMAVRRERVLELGGFDTALDVGTPTGGGGDLELFFRVVAAGDLLVYDPAAVVRHRHRQTLEGLERQRRGDGTGSYSWFLGAGREYGRRQYAAFAGFASWWVVRYHLRNIVGSLLWPALWPRRLTVAEIAGMVDAVVHGYYRRAVRQAEAELASHQEGTRAPVLVRAQAPPRGLRRFRTSVDVVIRADGLLVAPEVPPVGVLDVTVHLPSGASRVVPIDARGTRVSSGRLRWELAARLTPELERVLVPRR